MPLFVYLYIAALRAALVDRKQTNRPHMIRNRFNAFSS